MNKKQFQINRQGKWVALEDAGARPAVPGLRDFEPGAPADGVLLSPSDALRLLACRPSERFPLLCGIAGEAVCEGLRKSAVGYLASLRQEIRARQDLCGEVRTVTEEEYRDAVAFLEDNSRQSAETEKLLYDFEQLEECGAQLRRAMAENQETKIELRRQEKAVEDAREDRRLLENYERLQKGCSISYRKLREEEERLSALESEAGGLKSRREQLISELEELKIRQSQAEKAADDFSSSKDGQTVAIDSAQKLDGLIAVQESRCRALEEALSQKKNDARQARERLDALSDELAKQSEETARLAAYVDANSDLEPCCRDLEKVIDCMTKFIETDARLKGAEQEQRELSLIVAGMKLRLDEAETGFADAVRQENDQDMALQTVKSAKTSADENQADQKINQLGGDIEFLRSLQPDADATEACFVRYENQHEILEDLRKGIRSAEERLAMSDEKIIAMEKKIANLDFLLRVNEKVSEFSHIRSGIHDGERCPLCGGTVDGIASFIAEVNREKRSLVEDRQELSEERRMLEEENAGIRQRLDGLRDQNREVSVQLDETLDEINRLCRSLAERCQGRKLETRWDNGEGQFTAESFRRASSEIRSMLQISIRQFDDLLQLKDRNDKAFRNFTVMTNQRNLVSEKVSGIRKVRDELSADYSRNAEELKLLESDLALYRGQIAELDETLRRYMGERWDVLYNSFVRENHSMAEKEAAIAGWEKECRDYISSTESYAKMLSSQENRQNEEHVAKSTLDERIAASQQAEADLEQSRDELEELKEQRSRVLDDTVDHAMENLNAREELSKRQLREINAEVDAVSVSIENVAAELEQINVRIADCRQEISDSAESIDEFLEQNKDMTAAFLSEILDRKPDYYERLRDQVEKADDDLAAAVIANESSEAALRLAREEYDMKLRLIPDVGPEDITDGFLDEQWIERQRAARFRLDEETARRRLVTQRYLDEAGKAQAAKEELEEMTERLGRLEGDPELAEVDDGAGFSNSARNVTVARLAETATKFVSAMVPALKFRTVRISLPQDGCGISLEIVDESRGGVALQPSAMTSDALLASAVAMGLGLLEISGARGLRRVFADDSLAMKSQHEAQAALAALAKLKEIGLEPALFTSDPQMLKALETFPEVF
ncbi:MAG: hypothetical protein IJ523_00280 [Succinivibrionaceae bacterium]|nr:hypothetical protein [Succinivibrionaceae bacterium]